MPLIDPQPSEMVTSSLMLSQLRVLRVLGEYKKPLTAAKVAAIIGTSYAYTSRVIGYENVEKRQRVELGLIKGEGKFPSFITMGIVDRYEMDIDGLKEIGYELNEKGRELLESTANVQVPEFVGRKLKKEEPSVSVPTV